jgi:hypothetical protein
VEEEALIPFVLIGGFVAYCGMVVGWKSWKSRRLLSRARSATEPAEKLRLLRQALLSANESPAREGEILGLLEGVYAAQGVDWSPGDYRQLMELYQSLIGRGTGAALKELVEVQKLKIKLVESLPDL